MFQVIFSFVDMQWDYCGFYLDAILKKGNSVDIYYLVCRPPWVDWGMVVVEEEPLL